MKMHLFLIALFYHFEKYFCGFCQIRPRYSAVANSLTGSKQVILQVSDSFDGLNKTSCLALNDPACIWESTNPSNFIYIGFGVSPVRVITFITQGNLIDNWTTSFSLSYMSSPGVWTNYNGGAALNGNSNFSYELRRFPLMQFEAYAVKFQLLAYHAVRFTVKLEIIFEQFCRS